jgi:glycosyltransferase involved in cell wall biosynthesis
MGIQVVWGLEAAQEILRASGERYQFALLSRPFVAERYFASVRAYAPFAQVMYDCVDLHWVRLRRAAELTGDGAVAKDAESYYEVEKFDMRSADLVLAVTEAERQQIRAEWPEIPVAVLPNIHRTQPLPRPWAARRGLVFIGGYEHPPNVDAVNWFVKEVLPLIVRELPDVQFQMLGSKPPESLRELVSEHVKLVGYVPDPDPYFEEARVFVAPLRYGAGMKGKIGQAMSLGLPLVTTSIGAEGMFLQDGVHALIADGAEEFARAVIRLYRDEALWVELRRHGVAHIERHFSEAAVARLLEGLLSNEPSEQRPGAAA